MGHRRRRPDRRGGGRDGERRFGQPLAFNTASGEAFGVLVATPGIHAAAVERLRERAMALV